MEEEIMWIIKGVFVLSSLGLFFSILWGIKGLWKVSKWIIGIGIMWFILFLICVIIK